MPDWLTDYDIHLRHAAVRGGAWVGFRLAWKGLAGSGALRYRESEEPHRRWRPWHLDPEWPENPEKGHWGVWRWELDVAMLPGMVGLTGRPPTDGRGHEEMREDLHGYIELPVMQLQDVDGVVYSVRMTGFEERNVEGYDARHPNGGWLARVELAETIA